MLFRIRTRARRLKKRIRRGWGHYSLQYRARREYPSMADHDFRRIRLYPQDAERMRVLFITSNGAGMGHLTRCIAIARAGRSHFDSAIVTLSTSAAVVGNFDIPYLRFDSPNKSGLEPRDWNTRFELFLTEIMRSHRPSLIVFDGPWIYNGLVSAAEKSELEIVWLRRGLWKSDAFSSEIDRFSAISKAVITPADIGDSLDGGPLSTREDFESVPAITLNEETELLDSKTAKRRLGLLDERAYVLIQLGAGNINDLDVTRAEIIEAIRSYGPHLEPVVTISPLSLSAQEADEVTTIDRVYPIAPYLNAFEFVIAAGGYNSVHEMARFHIPGMVVPNLSTKTDDQLLRSEAFAQFGHGYCGADSQSILEGIRRLSQGVPVGVQDGNVSKTMFDCGEGAASVIASLRMSNDN